MLLAEGKILEEVVEVVLWELFMGRFGEISLECIVFAKLLLAVPLSLFIISLAVQGSLLSEKYGVSSVSSVKSVSGLVLDGGRTLLGCNIAWKNTFEN